VALICILFGTYADQVAVEELTKPPPSGNSVSPAVLGWKGKRILLITETEKRDKLHSAWLKRLRDQTTQLKARTLFKELVTFNPSWLIMIASNVDIIWTSLDGGVERSFCATPWPIKFGKNDIPAENVRKGDPSLKTEAVAKSLAPQFFFLLRAVKRVFFQVRLDTIIVPRPWDVVTCTAEQMEADTKGSLADFLENKTLKVEDYMQASTDAQVIRAFMEHAKELNKSEATTLLFSQVCKALVNGRRILKFKNTPGVYLKLN
jgi:hypothetical protein